MTEGVVLLTRDHVCVSLSIFWISWIHQKQRRLIPATTKVRSNA